MEELCSSPRSCRPDPGASTGPRRCSGTSPSRSSAAPEEAELAKLFTNTWRYIKFAAANQLFMIANDFGLDFADPRRGDGGLPSGPGSARRGFRGRPCLLKDTMQLAAFNNNNFLLGQASMMINEGLPLYMVSRLEDVSTCRR